MCVREICDIPGGLCSSSKNALCSWFVDYNNYHIYLKGFLKHKKLVEVSWNLSICASSVKMTSEKENDPNRMYNRWKTNRTALYWSPLSVTGHTAVCPESLSSPVDRRGEWRWVLMENAFPSHFFGSPSHLPSLLTSPTTYQEMGQWHFKKEHWMTPSYLNYSGALLLPHCYL